MSYRGPRVKEMVPVTYFNTIEPLDLHGTLISSASCAEAKDEYELRPVAILQDRECLGLSWGGLRLNGNQA
jgi:hypothetical protein